MPPGTSAPKSRLTAPRTLASWAAAEYIPPAQLPDSLDVYVFRRHGAIHAFAPSIRKCGCGTDWLDALSRLQEIIEEQYPEQSIGLIGLVWSKPRFSMNHYLAHAPSNACPQPTCKPARQGRTMAFGHAQLLAFFHAQLHWHFLTRYLIDGWRGRWS